MSVFPWKDKTVNRNVLQYKLSSLEANTQYTAYVNAANSAGGKNGNTVTFKTSKFSKWCWRLNHATLIMFFGGKRCRSKSCCLSKVLKCNGVPSCSSPWTIANTKGRWALLLLFIAFCDWGYVQTFICITTRIKHHGVCTHAQPPGWSATKWLQGCIVQLACFLASFFPPPPWDPVSLAAAVIKWQQ